MSSSSSGRGQEDQPVNQQNNPDDQIVLRIAEDELTCPISGRIFHTPVILLTENQENKEELDAGTTVEKQAYETWVANFNNNVRIDLKTNRHVRATLPDRRMQTLVNSYFEHNYPNLEERKAARLANQYQPAVVQEEKEREEKVPVENAQNLIPASEQAAPAQNPPQSPALNPEPGLVAEQPRPKPSPILYPNLFPRAANTLINLPLVVGVVPGSLPVNQNNPNTCKGLLVGAADSGKGAFLLAASANDLSDNYISTIGIDFKLLSHEQIRYQLWDTAGQERYRLITSAYYRGANFILFFGNNFDEINSRVQRVQEELPNMEFFALNYHRNDAELSAGLVEFNANNLSAPIQASKNDVYTVARHILSRLADLMRHLQPENEGQLNLNNGR